MSHKTELLLILLSLIVLVCSKAVIRRATYNANGIARNAGKGINRGKKHLYMVAYPAAHEVYTTSDRRRCNI